jgi:hypothetical protein
MSRRIAAWRGVTLLAGLLLGAVAALPVPAQADEVYLFTRLDTRNVPPPVQLTVKGYEHELLRQLESVGLKPAEPPAVDSPSSFVRDRQQRLYAVATLTATDRGVEIRLIVNELTDQGPRQVFDFLVLLGNESSVDANHAKIRDEIRHYFVNDLIHYVNAGGRPLLLADCIHPDTQAGAGDFARLSKNITLLYPGLLQASQLASRYAIRGWARDDHDYVCGAANPHRALVGATEYQISGFLMLLDDRPHVDLYWEQEGLGPKRNMVKPLLGDSETAMAREIADWVVQLEQGQN